MRNLTAKQKKELKRLFDQRRVTSCYDMTDKEYQYISNLNLHENFDHNADRYLSDLYFEQMRSQPSPRFI